MTSLWCLHITVNGGADNLSAAVHGYTYVSGDEAAFVITVTNDDSNASTDLGGIRINGLTLLDAGIRNLGDSKVSTTTASRVGQSQTSLVRR